MKYPNNGSFAMISQSSTPKVLFFDGVTRETRADFDVVSNSYHYGVAFSPDKTILAIGVQASPYLYLYDTETWTKLPDVPLPPPNIVNAVAFSPDGSLMAVAHSVSPYVTVYNTSDWSKLAAVATPPAGTPYGLAFNHDGSQLAVAHTGTPYVAIYNTSDWSKVADPAILPASTGRGCGFNHDGSLLAVVHQTLPYLTIYNTSDWSKVANPASLPNSTGYDAKFSPDGSLLAVAHQNGDMLKLYDTSDWSTIPIEGIDPLYVTTTGFGLFWLNNNELLLSTNGQPGVVKYAPDGSIIEQYNQFYSGQAVAGIRYSGWEINGTISEALAADTWIATAFDLETGIKVGRVTFSGTTFTIPVANPTPVSVTVEAVQGDIWLASEPNIAIGDKRYPTNPSSTPYYYVATVGGTTGVSEPVWPVTDGGTVVDGTITWQRVERLIQPITQSPLIPTPV